MRRLVALLLVARIDAQTINDVVTGRDAVPTRARPPDDRRRGRRARAAATGDAPKPPLAPIDVRSGRRRATGRPAVGVAFTRNEVTHGPSGATAEHHMFELRNAVLAALSLKRAAPALPVALFTDLGPERVTSAARALLAGTGHGRVFDYVLPNAVFEGRSDAEKKLLEGGGDAVILKRRQKLRSRLGRLLNLARKPFDLTLFVDDDTFFCVSEQRPLVKALRHLYATRKVYDVRATVFARDATEGALQNDAKRCVWSRAAARGFSATLEAQCLERAATRRSACGGAQGGAIAIATGDRSHQFVQEWVDAYLAHWVKQATRLSAGKYDEREARTFASDQGPLLDVAKQRCAEKETARPPWKLGALPRTMNVRDADAAPDCRNSVFGPVLFLHQKKYVRGGTLAEASARLNGVCARVNRPIHEGGLSWVNKTRPPFECGWMSPKGAPAGTPLL
jgi:hypothetical protein